MIITEPRQEAQVDYGEGPMGARRGDGEANGPPL
jgi:hypothetical protein